MTTITLLVAGLGFGLAYVNGGNDVSKGIATLVGSGLSDYHRAIGWGAAWTAVGGLLGAVLAGAMVSTFGGGLLTAPGEQPLAAGVATLFGAGAWVLIATRTGLPVSTTHAIVGSLVGVTALAQGVDGVRWSALAGKVFLPLLITPVLSLVLTVLLVRATRRFTVAPAAAAADCLCADIAPAGPVLALAASASLARAGAPALRIVVGTQQACAVAQPRAPRVTLDHLHWLTAGAASFARGLNDGPKIVALVLAASALGGGATLAQPLLFALVTAGMVLGSVVAGRRVTAVLAEKVTPMSHHEGFLANLVTAGLVTAGATLGLPMSTTHVSSGGIVGIGAQRSSLDKRTLRDIALAWLVTLPAAAALGIAAFLLAGLWP